MLSGKTRQAESPSSPNFLPPRDAAMRLVEESALQVAASDETILLLGETGVGKDVMARRIHEASARSGKRFVQINCAALPDGLLESELFGHVRGAYTGAVDAQPGQFEVAAGKPVPRGSPTMVPVVPKRPLPLRQRLGAGSLGSVLGAIR